MASQIYVNGVTLSDAAEWNKWDTAAYVALSSAAGTNTITATGPANLTSVATNPPLWFIPAATNTGATTINITPSGGAALGAKNVFYNGAACVGGEIRINVPCAIVYDGTQYNVIGSVERGLVLIQSQAASNSATIDFTTGITSTYDEYLVTVTDLRPATDNTDLWLRIALAGVFQAGVSDYRWGRNTLFDDGSNNAAGDVADAQIIVATGIDNGATSALSGEFRIFGPAGTANWKKITWGASFIANAGNIGLTTGSGTYSAAATAVDGLRFIMSSGNITSGAFSLYGVRK